MNQEIMVVITYRTFTNPDRTGGCLNERTGIKRIHNITESVNNAIQEIIAKDCEEINPWKDKDYHQIDTESISVRIVE